jgi:hypothetical protein
MTVTTTYTVATTADLNNALHDIDVNAASVAANR